MGRPRAGAAEDLEERLVRMSLWQHPLDLSQALRGRTSGDPGAVAGNDGRRTALGLEERGRGRAHPGCDGSGATVAGHLQDVPVCTPTSGASAAHSIHRSAIRSCASAERRSRPSALTSAIATAMEVSSVHTGYACS